MPEPMELPDEVRALVDDGTLRLWKYWCSQEGALTYEPMCEVVRHKPIFVLERAGGNHGD